MLVSVYTLSESDTSAVRYVGNTAGSLHRRWLQHRKSARLGGKSRRDEWVRALLERGADLVVTLVDTVTVEDRWLVEEAWICYYRYVEGVDLVNETDGGVGNQASLPALRQRAAKVRSRSLRGKPSGRLGAKLTPEQHVRVVSAASKGRHVRWHVKRGVINPECNFCRES